MDEFDKEQALARYIELWGRRHEEFDRLPDVERRTARGDYDFFFSGDIELKELEEEAQRNGFVLEWIWDGEDLIYTIEKMSPEDYAAYLAEEQEAALGDIKWRYEAGLIEP